MYFSVCLQYGLKYYSMDQIELDHVSQVIGYHPSYLEHFLKIQTFIMQGDGPLPYDFRHYLAIMVSFKFHVWIFDELKMEVMIVLSGRNRCIAGEFSKIGASINLYLLTSVYNLIETYAIHFCEPAECTDTRDMRVCLASFFASLTSKF